VHNLVDDNGQISLSSTKIIKSINGEYVKIVSLLVPHEIDLMLDEIESNFIRSIYDQGGLQKKQYIKKRDFSIMRSNVDKDLLLLCLGYTPDEIEFVISKREKIRKSQRIKKDTKKTALARIILKDRDRRINAMKTGAPQPEDIRPVQLLQRKQIMHYSKTTRRLRDTSELSNYQSFSHKLHRDYFKVAHIDNKRAGAAMIQNCRVLDETREDYTLPEGKAAWDKYWAIRGTSAADFVQSRNHAKCRLKGISRSIHRYDGKLDRRKRW